MNLSIKIHILLVLFFQTPLTDPPNICYSPSSVPCTLDCTSLHLCSSCLSVLYVFHTTLSGPLPSGHIVWTPFRGLWANWHRLGPCQMLGISALSSSLLWIISWLWAYEHPQTCFIYKVGRPDYVRGGSFSFLLSLNLLQLIEIQFHTLKSTHLNYASQWYFF